MKKNIADRIFKKTKLPERLTCKKTNMVWKSGVFYNQKLPNSGLITNRAINDVLDELTNDI